MLNASLRAGMTTLTLVVGLNPAGTIHSDKRRQPDQYQAIKQAYATTIIPEKTTNIKNIGTGRRNSGFHASLPAICNVIFARIENLKQVHGTTTPYLS
jgi:hypothetical protein